MGHGPVKPEEHGTLAIRSEHMHGPATAAGRGAGAATAGAAGSASGVAGGGTAFARAAEVKLWLLLRYNLHPQH